MPHIPVSDMDDPRIAIYRDLPSAPANQGSGIFIAESEQVVMRLLASDYEMVSALASDQVAERLAQHMPEQTPLYVAPLKILRDIVGFKFHRGALACAKRKPAPLLKEVIPQVENPFTAIICPHVVDPVNLGGILRTSAAFGAGLVLIGPNSTDPFSRRAVRVSMGAAMRVPVVLSEDLEMDLTRLRQEHSVQLIATVVDAAVERLPAAQRPHRIGLLLGHEGHGLDERWLSMCERKVTIPMEPGMDSLNVTVTAGIVMYHFSHAHREAPPQGLNRLQLQP